MVLTTIRSWSFEHFSPFAGETGKMNRSRSFNIHGSRSVGTAILFRPPAFIDPGWGYASGFLKEFLLASWQQEFGNLISHYWIQFLHDLLILPEKNRVSLPAGITKGVIRVKPTTNKVFKAPEPTGAFLFGVHISVTCGGLFYYSASTMRSPLSIFNDSNGWFSFPDSFRQMSGFPYPDACAFP